MKEKCKDAARSYYANDFHDYRGQLQHYEAFIPSHAQVLACRFINPVGKINGTLAGGLGIINKAHLLQILSPSVMSGTSGAGTLTATDRNISTQAINLAANSNSRMDKLETEMNKIVKAIEYMGPFLKILREDTITSSELSPQTAQTAKGIKALQKPSPPSRLFRLKSTSSEPEPTSGLSLNL